MPPLVSVSPGATGISPAGTGVSQVLENTAATEPARPAELAAGEQAAMDEIQRRLKEGSEVICVIRNSRDPKAKSEVLMLDHASPALLYRLDGRGRLYKTLQPTSLEVPRERTPIF